MEPGYLCVATRLRVRGPRVLPAFFRASASARRAARRTAGNVRTRLLGLPPFPTYYTLTVWESEAAMHSFVSTPEHRAAMTLMDDVATAGAFVEFRSPTPRVGWRAAMRRLRTDSAVHHQPQTQ
jgi:heme-degrading monooxygenase HmoA